MTRCITMTLAVLVSIAVGCKSSEKSESKPVRLEDVTWQLVELQGRPAEPVTAGSKPTTMLLSSADKRVTGYGGVNQFNGTYQLNGDSLRFGPLSMTRRAGPEPLMRQEDGFARAMMQTVSWRARGSRIELLDSMGNRLAKLAPMAP